LKNRLENQRERMGAADLVISQAKNNVELAENDLAVAIQARGSVQFNFFNSDRYLLIRS